MTTIVPGPDVWEAFETGLLRIAVNPPVSVREQLDRPGGLLRTVRRILPHDDAIALIVIDQFEELFTLVRDTDERDRFLRELVAALEAPRSPLRVVTTLRADHYDLPLRAPAVAEHVARGTVAVRPMTPSELEAAIVRPAHVVGVEVEAALVAELVAAVNDRPTALPLLQFALTAVFERRVADVMLVSTYHELGGLVGALTARAEHVVFEHGDGGDGGVAARRLFGRLVNIDDDGAHTRRRVLRRELDAEPELRWLTDALVEARLLATDRDASTREPTVEVAHEALLRDWPRLRSWLDEDRDDLRVARTVTAAATAWIRSDRDPGDLARGARLAAARDLAERRPELLSDEERDWVVTSAHVADEDEAARRAAADRVLRQNRRLRGALLAAAAFLAFALAAASVAVVQRGRARDGEAAAATAFEQAELGRLVALSAAQLEVDLSRAALLAVEANRRRDDPVTQGSVLRALAHEPRVLASFPGRLGEEELVRFSADGSVGVAWSADPSLGNVEVFDPVSGEPRMTMTSADGVDTVAVSGDGSVLAIVRGAATVELVRTTDGSDPVGAGEVTVDREVWEVALDGSGTRLAIGGGPVVSVHDVRTGRAVATVDLSAATGRDDVTIAPLAEPGALALSADGSRLAVAVDNWLLGDETFSRVEVVDVDRDSSTDVVESDFGGSHTVSVSPSGQWVVAVAETATGRNRVVLVDTDHGTVTVLGGHEGAEVRAVVRDDGSVTTVSSDGVVRFLEADGATRAPSVRIARDPHVVAAPEGAPTVVGLHGGGHVLVHEWDSVLIDRVVETDGNTRVAPGGGLATVLSDDRATLSAIGLDVQGVDGIGGRSIDLADVLPSGVFFWRESPDGRWVLAAGPEPALAVVEWETGIRHVVDLEWLADAVFGTPFDESSPTVPRVADGGAVFVRLSQRTGPVAAVWLDPAEEAIVRGPLALDDPNGPVLLLPDGQAVGSGRTHVLAADLSVVRHFDDLSGSPLAHDPNTGRVLVGGAAGVVALLDPDSGEVQMLESVRGFVTDGAFAPDGRRVAVRAVGSGIHLIDRESGLVIGAPIPVGDVGLQAGMSWSDDGLWFVDDRGAVRLVTEPSRWVSMACTLAGRDLTADEWASLVADPGRPPVPCT